MLLSVFRLCRHWYRHLGRHLGRLSNFRFSREGEPTNRFAALAGFTLVELVVYMAIFSIFSIGVTTLVLDIQSSFSKTKTFIEDSDDEALAIKRLEIQLGKSDRVMIDNVSVGDQACLRLRREKFKSRVGYKFNGLNQYFSPPANTHFFPSLDDPRSISVWVNIPASQSGVGTIIKWGQNVPYRKSALAVVNGRPRYDVGCGNFDAIGAPDLRDGKWHHIAFTHKARSRLSSNNSKFYIDGKQVSGRFTAVCAPTKDLDTDFYHLQVGADNTLPNSNFNGIMSDLRVFIQTASAADIDSLFKGDQVTLLTTAQWPMNAAPDYQWGGFVPALAVGMGTTAKLKGYTVDADPTFESFEADDIDHSFCFLDDNSDGRYAMWESSTAKSLPQRGGEAGWTRRTKENFVPTSSGFFNAIGNDPNSVVGNFAVVNGTAASAAATDMNKSKSFTTRRRTRHPELCAIAPALQLSSTKCNFSSAHIIVDNYDPLSSGYIEVMHAPSITSGSITTYQELPNMPTNVVGIWNHDEGIFSLKTNDGSVLSPKLWRRTLRNTLFRPQSNSFNRTQKFTFGLGGAPFLKNGRFHFYDFVQSDGMKRSNPRDLHPYATAEQKAATPDPAFCGMTSHLATITSEQENIHLGRVTRAAWGGVMQSGWLGGYVEATDQNKNWKWRMGSDNGTVFWQDKGQTGNAIIDMSDKTMAAPVYPHVMRKFGLDHLPRVRTNSYRRKIFANDGSELRFTDFAFGYPGNNCNSSHNSLVCEPYDRFSGNQYLSIQGDPVMGGLWYAFGARGVRPYCSAGNWNNKKICGHYRELSGTPTLDPVAVLGESVTVDMQRFHEFCSK
jgi:type II secretory pathway pseudopilin PulG